MARGRARVAVINESWRLAPWANLLYACDAEWWRKSPGWREFKGLKVSRDRALRGQFPEVRIVESVRSDDMQPAPKIGWGGNSGFQTINLVAHFRPRVMALVGFDMRIDQGLHWHGSHGHTLRNPTDSAVARWRAALDRQARYFEELGIMVVNASPISALTNYPKMTLEQALEH